MEDMLLYAKYAAAIVSGCLAIGLTLKFIQKMADLLMAGLVLGAIGLPCVGIAMGALSGWSEVIGASIGSGLIAGLLCTPLIPLSIGFQGGNQINLGEKS
jgi:hypothetical protein